MTKEEKKQWMNEVLANTMADLQRRIAMRDLALQHLRQEFEAAHAVYAARFEEDGSSYRDPAYVARWPHEMWSDFTEKQEMVEAARHYIIARDSGEWDRERALMLWKLQNGGAA